MAKEFRHFDTEEEFEDFRRGIWEQSTHTFGGWTFNWATGECIDHLGAVPVHITDRESDVLRVLINNMPNPLSGKQIDAELGRRYGISIGADGVKTIVRRLRNKGLNRIVTDESGYRFLPFNE